MFFRDPVAAFANIGRAVRPGGRLVMMVWQRHERNEWSVSIERALVGPGRAPDPASGMPRYARDVGQPAPVCGEVDKTLGRPARTYAEWVADHADAFQN
jgi:SAM-dependent methyltransferase